MTGAVYTWNTIYENPEGSATYTRPPNRDMSKLQQAQQDSQSQFNNYLSYKVWALHDDSRAPHILPFSTYRSYTGTLAQRHMQYTRLNQMNDPFFLTVLWRRSKENLSLTPIGSDSNHLAFVEEKYKNRFEDLFKPGVIKPIALPVLGEEGYDTGHFVVSRFVKASNYSASYPALVPNPSTAAEATHPKVSEENYSLFGMPANSSQPTVFQLLMYDDEYKDKAYSTANTARGIGINAAHFDAIYANGYNSGVYQTNQKGLTLAYPLHMPVWSTTDISDAIKEAVKFGMSDKEKVPNADFFDKAFIGTNRWDSPMNVKYYYYTKDAITYYKNKVGPLFKYSEANAIKMYKEVTPTPPRGAVFKRDNRLYLNGVWVGGISGASEREYITHNENETLSAYIERINSEVAAMNGRGNMSRLSRYYTVNNVISRENYSDRFAIKPFFLSDKAIDKSQLGEAQTISEPLVLENILSQLKPHYNNSIQTSLNRANHVNRMQIDITQPKLDYLSDPIDTLKRVVRMPLVFLRGELLASRVFPHNGKFDVQTRKGGYITIDEFFYTTLYPTTITPNPKNASEQLSGEFSHKNAVSGTYVYDTRFGFHPWTSYRGYGYGTWAEEVSELDVNYTHAPGSRFVYHPEFIVHPFTSLMKSENVLGFNSVAIDIRCNGQTMHHQVVVDFPEYRLSSISSGGGAFFGHGDHEPSLSLFKVEGDNNRIHVKYTGEKTISVFDVKDGEKAYKYTLNTDVYVALFSVVGRNNIITLDIDSPITFKSNDAVDVIPVLMQSTDPSNILIIQLPEGTSPEEIFLFNTPAVVNKVLHGHITGKIVKPPRSERILERHP